MAYLLAWVAVFVALAFRTNATNEFGKKFLAENAKNAGVIELSSGLQYRVLREGDGDESPLASTSCECHYEGRTAQEHSKNPKGKKFDSSYDRGSPTSFAPNQVIRGWTEAMQLMVEGDKWQMFIPSELGYGDGGQGADIGGGDVLVFTMEILKINGPTKPADRGPPGFTEYKTVEDFTAWASGGSNDVLVLGLFRKPTVGKLFNSFKSSARAWAKTGEADVALYAQSRYDSKAKKYQVSELESVLDLQAPGIYFSNNAGKSWTSCKTKHSAKDATLDSIKTNIAKCIGNVKEDL